MFGLTFHREKQTPTKPYTGKYYVILIEDNPYKVVEIWINVDKIFRHNPCNGDYFKYKMCWYKKPLLCRVMAICDTEADARDVARNLYV